MARLRTAVLISGRGSNLQALIDAARRPGFPAEIVRVVSNRPQAAGLERAKAAGIPVEVVDQRSHPERGSFERALHEALRTAGVELVCLAGFMRILGPSFVELWANRILNIHPSLLPAFPGLHTHERALAAGVRISGCTVHIVRSELDKGPILVQAAVPVAADDTPESLAARVLKAEHLCYPLALSLMASGRARVIGEVVRIEGARAGEPLLINPAPEA